LLAGLLMLVMPSAAAAPTVRVAGSAGESQAGARSPQVTLAQAPVSLRAAVRRTLPQVRSVGGVPEVLAGSHAPGDLFGSAVAISGTTAIVGAYGVNDFSGAAYIYVRSGKTWHQQATLSDPAGGVQDTFGCSVALSGTTAVVGAPGVNDVAGAAYIYVRTGKTWHQQAELADPVGTTLDYFGCPVAVSGETVLISSVNANNNIGVTYVYVRTGTTWRRQASLTLPGGGDNAGFGTSVAISGGTAVIGAPGVFAGIGAAYVYARSGQRWRQQARLIDPAGISGQQFGSAVALSGATAAIGAVAVGQDAGAAWVYVRSGTTWRRHRLTDPQVRSGAEFGVAVAVSRTTSGTRVLVGASNAVRRICGSAYDFARSGTKWREKAKVVDPGCAVKDRFGTAVALDGRTAFIGAPMTNKDAGAVYELTIP
jgi:hypothetical protein